MASIKELKKDINFLTSEVVETCLLKLSFDKDANSEDLYNIIEDFIDFRNETIHKLNNPEESDKKASLKKYYNTIFNQFLEKVNLSFEKLNNSSKEEVA